MTDFANDRSKEAEKRKGSFAFNLEPGMRETWSNDDFLEEVGRENVMVKKQTASTGLE